MKKAFACLLAFLITFSFAACGEKNTAEKTKESTVSQTVKEEKESETKKEGTVSVTEPDSNAQPEALPISIGETVTTRSCEFTLNKIEFSYDVKPDTLPSYYNHYPASVGQVYIYVNANVKNIKKQELSCDEIYSVEVDYNNGYKYTGFNIVTDTDGDFTYANITAVEPLQTMGVHCLVDCPEEVEASDAPVVITIKFKDGAKYTYKMR